MSDDILNLNILICDDSITNVLILEKLMEHEGFKHVTKLTDPTKVVPTMQSQKFDLLLLDIEMPNMNGFEVMQAIEDSGAGKQLVPILILTGKQGSEVRNKALESGAQDFVNKPFDTTEVVLRVKNLLKVRLAYLSQAKIAEELEIKVQERTAELEKATSILIKRMAQAGEMRDTDTGKHVMRVGQYARILSDASGLPLDIGYLIEKAAPLHDLGKIGIPDSILLKAGKLTEEERKVMDGHAQKGADLLSDHESMLIQMAASIAITHHERWDGTGYPNNMSGESIPIEGRIAAISDVFDALTTVRPYKDAWPIDKAVELIKSESGKQFDPTLVEVFIKELDKIIDIREKYGD